MGCEIVRITMNNGKNYSIVTDGFRQYVRLLNETQIIRIDGQNYPLEEIHEITRG